MTVTPDWIAVDWGTSQLRVWAMAGDRVLAAASSEDGMGRLSPEGFQPALLRLIEPWLGTAPMPVIACGMVGARQGWAEAPYRPVPCAPVASGALMPVAADPRLALRFVPGLSQRKPGADVMRGEETQIAGVLATLPDFDGIVCLPGTHTKWAHLSAGEVVSFQTFLTGEMFALLAGQSVLRHTVGATGWDDAAFAEAVADAITSPARVSARLFGLRAEALLADLAPETARARLSGLLIGAELAAARPYWLGQRVVIVAADGIAHAYVAALAAQGVQAELLPAEQMTLAGLTLAQAGETP